MFYYIIIVKYIALIILLFQLLLIKMIIYVVAIKPPLHSITPHLALIGVLTQITSAK